LPCWNFEKSGSTGPLELEAVAIQVTAIKAAPNIPYFLISTG
jgi:hypothetical protein